jgi:crotonobetainyl-CoA:carnitine CoA-transferase CaiB-like acyl-CoA transferase
MWFAPKVTAMSIRMTIPSRGGSFASMSPLKNVRVIEFCQIAAGPFAGLLLADMGADVIKVESPEGDGMRNWPPHTVGYSENFASLNRGKKSVVLNLKANGLPGSKTYAFPRMWCRDFRPGVMQRLGLGYEDLSRQTLVYCSISAFGQEGPRSQEGARRHAAGDRRRDERHRRARRRVKSGVPLTDFAAGLYAAFSIAASLFEGKGRHRRADAQHHARRTALQTSEYFGSRKGPASSARPIRATHPTRRSSARTATSSWPPATTTCSAGPVRV